MINYQKIFFGLFLSLIFIFPEFIFAQTGTDVPPGAFIPVNCQSGSTTLSPMSQDSCDTSAAKLAGICTVTHTFSNNSCTITYSMCSQPCKSLEEYLKGSQVASGTSDNSNQGGAASVPLINPLKINSPQLLVGSIINSTLGIVGSLALIMFIYGGFIWLTSGGSAENVKKGREIIVWAVIGLVIVFLSYGLVKFLISNIK